MGSQIAREFIFIGDPCRKFEHTETRFSLFSFKMEAAPPSRSPGVLALLLSTFLFVRLRTTIRTPPDPLIAHGANFRRLSAVDRQELESFAPGRSGVSK